MSKPTFICILIVVLSLGWPIDTSAKTKVEPPNNRSPNTFAVEVDTTKGKVVVEVYRSWAPNSADRFYNMVKAGYLDGSIFYWVVSGSNVAFGYNADPKKSEVWLESPVSADIPRREIRVGDVYLVPVFYLEYDVNAVVAIQTGIDGSYASRDGATPFGRVVEGAEILDQLDDAHMKKGIWVGNRLISKGDKKVRKKFPQIDSVTRASVLDRTPDVPNASEIDDQFVMDEEIPPNHALLRIYRKDVSEEKFNIRVDGVLVARLKGYSMYQTYLPAGSHELSGKSAVQAGDFLFGVQWIKAFSSKSNYSGDFKAGAVYHIRAAPFGPAFRNLALVRIANEYGSKVSMSLPAAEELTDEEVSPIPSDVN